MQNTFTHCLLFLFFSLRASQAREEPQEGDFNLVYFANETKVNEFLSLGRQFFALYFVPYSYTLLAFIKLSPDVLWTQQRRTSAII